MMAGEREVEAAAHAVCGYGGVDRGREGFDRGYWSLVIKVCPIWENS